MTGISSAPHNFLTRLLGTKTYRNPNEDPTKPENLFGTDPLATTEARPAGAMPAKTTPAQTPTTQELAGNEPSQPQSRYQFMQMFQPKPMPDTESEEVLKKRARINALGRGLGAIGALVGTQNGAVVAPYLPDTVGPWVLNQQQINDQDYRNRLQDWVDKSFQVDSYNTGLVNKEVDQQIDAENRMAQIQEQGYNQQVLAEQRAQYALQQLQAKSQAEQIKEMEAIGINPNGENAYGEYLQAQKRKYNADLAYTNARANWNNRYGTSGKNGKPTFDIPTLQAGKKAMLDELAARKKSAAGDQVLIEEITEMEKQIRNYNPGANEILDAEVMARGQQAIQGGGQQPRQAQGFGDPYTPGKGFNNMGQQAPTADPDRDNRIQTSLQRVASQQANIQDLEALLQDIVDGGYAPDLATAEEYVYELINGEQ